MKKAPPTEALFLMYDFFAVSEVVGFELEVRFRMRAYGALVGG